MPGLKRAREEKGKGAPVVHPAPPEADFPRGGGTGLTPLEYRQTLLEARAEAAAADLFPSKAAAGSSKKKHDPDGGHDEEEHDATLQRKKKQKLNRDRQNNRKKKVLIDEAPTSKGKAHAPAEHDGVRVEHLNYKRLQTGTRLFCTVLAVHPLAVVLSLPNQLLGHVPITNISLPFTERLEADVNSASDDDDDEPDGADSPPTLRDLYAPGQWVQASVVKVLPAGAIKGKDHAGREGGEYERESRRVELSLSPHLYNEGVAASDIGPDYTMPCTINSVEDHGYVLDSGIDSLSGFCKFADTDAPAARLAVGSVHNVRVLALSDNARTFTATLKAAALRSATLLPTSDPVPSVAALLPGQLVSALVTSSASSGLNVKLFGMFDGTIDRAHLPEIAKGKTVPDVFPTGKKVKARILWDLGADDDDEDSGGRRKVGLSARPHVVEAKPASLLVQHETGVPDAEPEEAILTPLAEALPVGTRVQATVVHTSSDWGLNVQCALPEDHASGRSIAPRSVGGFVHISRVADEHVTALSAKHGAWTAGTTHEARVVGHSPTDGILLVDLRPSTLALAFLRVSELQVGAVLKATIQSVQLSGIFLDLNGHTHGVVFPLHFSDTPTVSMGGSGAGSGAPASVLKKLEKRFRVGASVRARILAVDPERNRISLTLKRSLVESDDLAPLAHIDDAFVGRLALGVVSKFISAGALVDFYGGLRALLPASEAAEAYTADLRAHFGGAEGKVVKVRITSVDALTGRLVVSVRQALPAFQARLNVDAVDVGQQVRATVAAVHADVVVLELERTKTRALVSVGILARIRGTPEADLKEALQEGELVEGLHVVNKNAEKGLVILGPPPRSAGAANGATAAAAPTPLKIGGLYRARVIQNSAERNVVTVFLPGNARGRLHVTDCADDYAAWEADRAAGRPVGGGAEEEGASDAEAETGSSATHASHLPPIGTSLEVCVLALRSHGRAADVSIRPSVLARARGLPFPSTDASIPDAPLPPQPLSVLLDAGADRDVLSVGTHRRGFVKTISDKGLFVDLGPRVTARVQITECHDGFVKDWKKGFRVGQLVKGKVLSIDKENHRLEFTLRKLPSKASKAARPAAAPAPALRLQDLSKGDKVKGFVRAIADFGLFVQIEGTEISGLCHRSQLSDSGSADALKAFAVGDRVRAVVLEVMKEKRKVAFGLKPSYFEGDDDEESGGESEEESGEESEDEGDDADMQAMLEVMQEDGESSEEASEDEEMQEAEAEQEGEESEGDYVEMDEDAPAPAPKPKKAANGANSSSTRPALELSHGFSWSARSDDEQSSDAGSDSDDSDADTSAAPPKSKKRKAKGVQAIAEDVTADLATKAPSSSTDFERLLLGSPNSSYLWIQFMSYHLQLSDLERARAVARRALKVINFREEDEKLNVWLALLNLENTYGDAEARDAVFAEAVQANDACEVHMRMLDILERTEKTDEARELWRKTAKKFGHSSKVWVAYRAFELRQGDREAARQVVQRSMQSLEKRKHVKTITAYALTEFKSGDPEQGRTIFEGLVDSYPKRLDLWWQYIDQESKLSNVSGVRTLFERVLALKQSSKKAKSVLKKWLSFEKAHGDKKGEQQVLNRARSFVEAMKAKAEALQEE